MYEQQRVSIGRDVHYVAYGTPGGEYLSGAHRAAKITEVDLNDPYSTNVSLFIINPTGQFFLSGLAAKYDPTGTTPGTWHWPERV